MITGLGTASSIEQAGAINLVIKERDRQDAKWGSQRELPRHLWGSILGEEFGEVCKANLECVATFKNGEQNTYGDVELLEELSQVAAVAVAWMEDLLTKPNGIRSIKDLPDEDA